MRKRSALGGSLGSHYLGRGAQKIVKDRAQKKLGALFTRPIIKSGLSKPLIYT